MLRLLVFFLLVGGGGLAAQERVGSSLVNGKAIELFSDYTWRYRSDSDETGCLSIKSGIEFCEVSGSWAKTRSSSNEDSSAEFRYDDKNYGMVIVEEVGADDGMGLEFMKSVVVDNFAGAAGISKEDVLVLAVEDGSVSGKSSSMVVYGGKVDGLPLIYSNTIVSEPSRTSQFVTYSIERELSEEHRRLHNEFLSAVRFIR